MTEAKSTTARLGADARAEYTVPDMEWIRAQEKNGLKLVSTFSGAGGSHLGFEMEGYETLWASEFIPAAQDTHRANFPDVHLDTRDIREVTGDEILDATGLDIGELDVLEGSPPCASFSSSGKLNEDWGKERKYSDTVQRVDDLFFEFARLLHELKPRAFVAENVLGLTQGVSKGYLKQIYEKLQYSDILKDPDYMLRARIVDGARLGCATHRERVIIIGLRTNEASDKLGRKGYLNWQVDPYPRPWKQRFTVEDAIGGMRSPVEGQCWWMPPGKVFECWKWCRKHQEVKISYASKALYGKETMFNHKYALWHKACPTLTDAMCVYHPQEPRTLSIDEIKRLSTFPHDFHLTGSTQKKWERVGRAVPPMMMRSVANSLKGVLL